MSFAERVLAKKPKIDANEFESFDLVPYTSNVAERFTIQVRLVFTDYRTCYHTVLGTYLAVKWDFLNAEVVTILVVSVRWP